MNAKLQKSYLKINEECTHLIKDCEQVTFTEKGDIDKSNIQLTHISDGCGYWVSKKFPIVERSDLVQVSNLM